MLERYPAYIDSRIEWLGEIPSGWMTVPLWTLFQRVKRTGFEHEELLSVYRDHGVVIKSSRDDNNNNASEDLSSYQLVEPGDLAINKMKAWQGSAAISDHRGIVSPAYFIFHGHHREHDRFLHYLMRSLPYTAAYARISKGIRPNQWDLDSQQHSRLPIVIPPGTEQLQIADYLDAQTAKIDALIEKQEKLIEMLAERRQAVISHAVTRGLDPNAAMQASGVEWIGLIPAHWQMKRMKNLGGIKYGLGEPPEYADEGIPLIRATNVSVGRITPEKMAFVNPGDISPQRIYWLREGDIVVVRSGALTGDSGLIGREYAGAIAGFDMVFRSSVITLPGFIQYTLLSTYVKSAQLDIARMRAAQPHLNAEELGNVIIATPSVEVQREIIAHLDHETSKIDALSDKAREMIEVLRERRQALVSAAVTGKIDVRGLA